MSKVILESRLGKYLILKLSEIPLKPYNKVKIRENFFNLVPMYDTENCIAIESNDSFFNEEVEFILE